MNNLDHITYRITLEEEYDEGGYARYRSKPSIECNTLEGAIEELRKLKMVKDPLGQYHFRARNLGANLQKRAGTDGEGNG